MTQHQPADVTLADGVRSVIRGLTPEDRQAVQTLHAGRPDAGHRLRVFGGGGRRQGRDYVEHLYADPGPAVCLVATIDGRVVGVVTAKRIDDDTAQVAFLVAELDRSRGLGSLLLEHVAAAARTHGIHRLRAEIMIEDTTLPGVFGTAGVADPALSAGATTLVPAEALAAADRREAAAEAHALTALLRARRVAVVGDLEPDGRARAVVDSIRRGGFTGELTTLHQRGTGLGGRLSLSDLPGPLDLVVVALPPAAALGVVSEAAIAGVRTLVIVPDGSGQLSGMRARVTMARIARSHGMRLVGPGSLGIIDNDPAIRLNATLTGAVPPTGGLAIAAQSPAAGEALLEVAVRRQLGVSSFVSLGDKADVSGNDLLTAWLEDPLVSAAALSLESLGNTGTFIRVARAFSERKPLLMVVSAYPSAAMVPLTALAGHTGIISCPDVASLARTASLLADREPLPGRRPVAGSDQARVERYESWVGVPGSKPVPYDTRRGRGTGHAVRAHLSRSSHERRLTRAEAAALIAPYGLVIGARPVALGLVRDPDFGPLVVVGAGPARSHLVPPADVREVTQAVAVLPESRRGVSRADLLALGRLCDDVPEIELLDLVTGALRLSFAVGPDAGLPRPLRRSG